MQPLIVIKEQKKAAEIVAEETLMEMAAKKIEEVN